MSRKTPPKWEFRYTRQGKDWRTEAVHGTQSILFTSRKPPYASEATIARISKTCKLPESQVRLTLSRDREQIDRLASLAQMPADAGEGGIDWDDQKPRIHPALDFLPDGRVCVGARLPQKGGGWQNCLIWSDKHMDKLTPETLDALPYTLRVQADLPFGRWSLKSIKSFLDGSSPPVSIEDGYNAVMAITKKYLDLGNEDNYSLFSLWTLATYYYPLFSAFPYLLFWGVKNAGKSRALKVLSQLAFNGQLTVKQSPAALFRTVDGLRSTLLLDEAELLHRGAAARNELHSLLLGGYQAGLTVPRAAEILEGGVKRYEIIHYDVYSPKALGSIAGVEDTLRSRCITMVMLRTLKPEIGGRVLDLTAPEWGETRDLLYSMLMSNGVLGSAGSERNQKGKLISGIYVKNGKKGYIPFPLLHERYPALLALSNRSRELWLPILALAGQVSEPLFARMLQMAHLKQREREASEAVDNRDALLVQALLTLFTPAPNQQRPSAKWIATKDVGVEHLRLTDELNYEDRNYPRVLRERAAWCSRSINRLGLAADRRRRNTGVELLIGWAALRDATMRLGMKSPDSQPTQKEASP